MLGGIGIGISLVLFLVLFCIGFSIGEDVTGIFMLVWILVSIGVWYFLCHFFGYLVKTAHIAVISEYMISGFYPENQYAYGFGKVKQRFPEMNEYYTVYRLAKLSVSQIQSFIDKIGSSKKQTESVFSAAAKLCNDLMLKYVNDCCVGYAFYNEQINTYKSSCDGIVIYYRNWKRLLRNSSFTVAFIVISTLLIAVLFFTLFMFIFRAIPPTAAYAFVIAMVFAFFFTHTLKVVFIDAWVLAGMYIKYMRLAPDTDITADVHSKLCSCSPKYREMLSKGRRTPDPVFEAANMSDMENTRDMRVIEYDENALRKYTGEMPIVQYEKTNSGIKTQGQRTQTLKPLVCRRCGYKNRPSARFCENCGGQLRG